MNTKTLATVATRRADTSIFLRIAILALASALLAASAYMQVPAWPVKISMQTAVVFAIGIALGSRMAVAAVLLYIAEGVMGLPVFQNGSAGPLYLLGPTGGYLLGFVLAAYFVGRAAETGLMSTFGRSVLVLVAANVILYVPGVAWLAVLIGADKALAAGVLPFLLGDALKILLVASLVSVGILPSTKSVR
ncbi:biotin transporter BioY [Microvirga zambiensis]|uniref:biotin transporter BioY n=1 Tax=Microvirga zambiensis TaxID=1402137 RepID=UPI00191E676C|nr:biotin transporter BioY [Microvirga zambiensis]